MRWIAKLALLAALAVPALAQTPIPYAAYISASPGNWNPWTSAQVFGALGYTPQPIALYCQATAGAAWTPCNPGGGGGSGTVTSFSSGNLSPLFTTSVANPTTTPALSFTLSTQSANTFLRGPTSGSAANPSFGAIVAGDINAALAAGVGPVVATSVNATAGVTSSSDGTHAGIFGLYGNTANPSIPANEIGFLGPTSASFTSYFLQFPTTAPAANQVIAVGAPSSSAAPVTYISNATTVNSQPCALGGSCTVTAAPNAAINLAASGAGGVTGVLPEANGGTGVTVGVREPCGIQLWNGGSAITASTYTLKGRCYNGFGATYTISGIACYVDAGSASTVNVSDSLSNALLTGAITGSAGAFTAGTQSSTTTIASGVWTTWTVVADGTATAINCVMNVHL